MALHAGLAPEVSWVGLDGQLQAVVNVTFNILRPEAVESLYMLWRVTGDARFRDMGWRIFEAFTAASRARPAEPLPKCFLMHGLVSKQVTLLQPLQRVPLHFFIPRFLSHEGCMCCGLYGKRDMGWRMFGASTKASRVPACSDSAI